MSQFNLQHPYFIHIKNGAKTAEGRIAKEKYLNLKNGDKIEFISNKTNEKIGAIVTGVNKYKSFGEMLNAEGLKTMLPDIDSMDKGVAIYESFGDFKTDVIKKGCVSIRFKIN